jgi:fimbrial chaperone protein
MKKLSQLLTAAAIVLPGPVAASDIRVAPVVLDPLPGARTTSLTLVNAEKRPVRVQVRVMKWSARNGADVLEPTTDVVASPPFATLTPQQHYLVRVVRTAKRAPAGEEAYRVLVDEVPDPTSARPGTVNLVVRQSLPVFFSDIPRRAPNVAWNLERSTSGAVLVGRNTGTRRLRVADLQVQANGQRVAERAGLVGYVLAGSELRVPLDARSAPPANAGWRIALTSDGGRLEMPVVAQSAR